MRTSLNKALEDMSAYAEIGGPMPDLLAAKLSLLSTEPGSIVDWVARRHGPEKSVSAVEAWAQAAQRLPMPNRSSDRLGLADKPLAALGSWFCLWARAISEDDQKAMRAWRGLSVRLAPASIGLARALGGVEIAKQKIHEEMGRLMRQAIRGAAIDAKREALERARLWMDMAIEADCPSSQAKGLSDELAQHITNPSAWRVASLACARGATVAPGMEGRARQWINCALTQHVSSASKHAPASERVACAQAVLGAMGFTIKSYRGSGGEPFDAMAMGALWAWPNDELAVELSLAGLVWSPSSKKRAPGLAARMMKSSAKISRGGAHKARAAALGIIEVVCGQGGMGSFGPDWEELALEVDSNILGAGWEPTSGQTDVAWADGFARWGKLSGWKSSDWIALAKSAPSLMDCSPALASAIESASIREGLAAEEPLPTSPGPGGGERAKARL